MGIKGIFSCWLLLIFYTTITKSQPANINVSQDFTFDGEPYLAVNPTNPQNIVVAWMGVTINPVRVSIKTKTSFDGGQTWGNYFVQPHFSPTWGSADVSMAFQNNGTVYLSYIDFRHTPDSGGIYITHSMDGGITWSAPTQVWNGNSEDAGKEPIDRPWLVVDNSATANAGTLYITTKPAYWFPTPNRPYLKYSNDSGQTWSPFRYIDTTGSLAGNVIVQPMAAPAVAADGALCITYPSYDVAQSVYPKMLFAKSYSRGSTFSYHDLVVNPPAVHDTNYKAGYRLAANPANANQICFASMGNQTIELPSSRPGSLIANSTRSPLPCLVFTFASYCSGANTCSKSIANCTSPMPPRIFTLLSTFFNPPTS